MVSLCDVGVVSVCGECVYEGMSQHHLWSLSIELCKIDQSCDIAHVYGVRVCVVSVCGECVWCVCVDMYTLQHSIPLAVFSHPP